MTRAPLRVLCLDIEGGYGGSSRSLWEFLRHIDRPRIEVEVWCRRAGPAQDRYKAEGIATRVTPDMPTVSALPKFTRNLLVFGRFLLRTWPRSDAFRQDLLRALESRFDLLHCNHESLFAVANWLRPRISLPMTCHIRTNLWHSPFARFQVRKLAAAADGLVFITENEKRTFETHLRRDAGGTVILNPATLPEVAAKPLTVFSNDPRYRVACLSNFSWGRGVDRLIELAEAFVSFGRRDVLFIVAGDMRVPRAFPGSLGQFARRGGTFADYAASRGVADMFAFLGHVDEPERVLASAHALIKPTREANPWGRDIIEALAASRPVITLGSWTGFVSPGETGILQRDFDARAMAAEIAGLADDRTRSSAMGQAGRARIAAMCDPGDRAADLLAFWDKAASIAAGKVPQARP